MDKYGLIGYPLVHSFSISYFNEKFKNEGIDAVYENYEIPTIEQLPEVLDTNPELPRSQRDHSIQGESDKLS